MAILTLTINYPCIFSGPWITFPRWRSGINLFEDGRTINSLVCSIQPNTLRTMAKSSKSSSSNENSPNSDVSENEAIYQKPVRAAAARARKTLTFKSSSSGDLSNASSKSWCSTKSGRLQLAKSSSEEPEEIVIGPRPKTRSPKKSCRAQDENSVYPRLGQLQSPIKRTSSIKAKSSTQAPSGLFKRRPSRPRGAKNKNRGGSISDPGTRASKGGKC